MTSKDLWTAEEAAEQVGVSVWAIYTWVKRGHLSHAGRRGRYKLFRLADVFEAEKTRSHQHRRRSNQC